MRSLVLISVLAFLASLPGAAQDTQLIYDDALQNGWQNWGWATLNYSNTSPVHGGSKSLSVVDPTTSYQAVCMHHAMQDTSLYQSLRFWIYVTSGVAQPVQVKATRNASSPPPVKIGNLTPNAWTQVTVSLAALGVANVTDFDGIWIQNCTGGPQTFYVDDVALIAAPPPNPIQLSVDAASVIRTIDGRIYGLNTATWDSKLGSTATADFLATTGVQVLRFPGGSGSDDYEWQTNRTVSLGTFQWASGAATFARVAETRGAQACVTVNYGSGTPEMAAAWVAYYNGSAANTSVIGVDAKGRDWKTVGYWAAMRSAPPLATDDGYNFLRAAHPAPYGFKYWEIGNECYGSWEYDLHGVAGSGLTGVAHDPYTYAQAFAVFRSKMLAVDPTIRIGAVGAPGEDAYGNGTHGVPNPNAANSVHTGWTPVVLSTLKSLGVAPHFLIDHMYPQSPGVESDPRLLQAGTLVAADAANLRKMITDYFGTGGAGIELQMTELNSVTNNPGKQSVSLVNGLYFADVMGQMARTEFNACMWWGLRNSGLAGNNNSTGLYGWRQFGDYGLVSPGDRADTPLNTPYPAFYAAKLLTHWGRGGDQVVSAASNYKLLAVHAARLADGSLALLVVNKSATTDLTAQIALTGFLPGSTSASVFAYGKANDLANGDITAGTITNAAANFTATFPSYSMTVIVLGRPQSFDAWRALYFTPSELSGGFAASSYGGLAAAPAAPAPIDISGPTADPDGDGVPNLMEYALALEPKVASVAGMPLQGRQAIGGKSYLTLSFTKPRTIGDLQYAVEVSDDLQTWRSGPGYTVRLDDGSTDQAVYRDAAAIGDGPRHFLRLQVTLP